MRAPFGIAVSLRLLWLLTAALSFAGYATLLLHPAGPIVSGPTVSAALLLLGACWLYLSLRLLRFLPRLRAFFRRLLANDYSTGIRDIPRLKDEISALTDLTNRTADRLRAYDELRAERTGLSYRAMDLLLRTAEQPIILADMDKQQFRFNPAAQHLYDVKQETYSFDAIEKLAPNARFFRAILPAPLTVPAARRETAVLQLPQRETTREIRFRLEPLKDKAEKVRLAFLFIEEASPLPPPTDSHDKR